MNESSTIEIRLASPDDCEVIVEFNRLMALETEHKALDLDLLRPGVATVLSDLSKGVYLVAEIDGRIVGQLMITFEWSDWRNGWFWWIQSVYVEEAYRRRNIFRSLFDKVIRLGTEAGNVIGVRLYVEKDNTRAQSTYRNLLMEETAFLLYERCPLVVTESRS